MSDAPPQTALVAFLKAKDPAYYGKVCELREAVRGWLNYIPQTFPHYTRHTVEHSEEIVSQISRLLFRDGDPGQSVVDLSPVEAYILIAAAYLHDAGMVTSDSQKQDILASDDWKSWVTDGPGANRWEAVQGLREGNEPADDAVRHFLADGQTRFLIAEFVRRTHHVRAADVITAHEATLGCFAFGDPMLRSTIADICTAHGLRPHELDDRERFPDRRDLRGHPTNVRFMAILLRLGDLLDTSHDRACPLLLNAACPLPADSLAYWTQYRRITHCLTAPDRIEITAECQTQDEHRLIQDWCQWIVDEVKEASTLMARADRHGDWRPPYATLIADEPSIVIKPAEGATYVPSRWTFELDHEAVFQRLVYDVYDQRETFVRELIQNALDANRCQMYGDLVNDGIEPPEYPTQVDEDRRRRYPVQVRLREEEMENELSGETERRQVLTVEDCGIGMDNEIIQRYFLQVGRSYYTTDEFRRSFAFVPTSRFGLGFLSVFAVSDHVTVDTFKPISSSGDGPIRLTLTGPRNYLLTEHGQRKSAGTRIEVTLREPIKPRALTDSVSEWCRMVEFPILIDDLGAEMTLQAERPDQFTYEMPDVTKEGAQLAVRAFAVDRPGIEGHLYVFAHLDQLGENWGKWRWATSAYPTMHPRANVPPFPAHIICMNGVALFDTGHAHPYAPHPTAERLDIRSASPPLPLARQGDWHRLHAALRPHIDSRWQEIVANHLSTTPYANQPGAWKYKQRLVDYFPMPAFWSRYPATIRVHQRGHPTLLSLRDTVTSSVITVTVEALRLRAISYREAHRIGRSQPSWDSSSIFLTDDDLDFLSSQHRHEIFHDRQPTNLRWLSSGHLAVDWSTEARSCVILDVDSIYGELAVVELPCPGAIGFNIHPAASHPEQLLLNARHPFVRWLLRVQQACEHGVCGLSPEQFGRLVRLLDTPVAVKGHRLDELEAYLTAWRNLPDIPEDLQPPTHRLTKGMFQPA